MRFYNPEDPKPEPLDSGDLFPRATKEDAIRRCLAIGLVPSVTNVLGCIREEYLERWKMRESIRNFTRHGNAWQAVETLFEDSKESSFGTEVHACIHNFLTGKPVAKGKAWNHALPLVPWLKRNVKELIAGEISLACEKTGAGGTVDLVFIDQSNRMILGDIKVVKFREKYPPKPSLSYKIQLSAYEMMLEKIGITEVTRLSLYLASPFGDLPEPQGKIFLHEKDYKNEFRSALNIWHAQFGNNCTGPKELEID